MHNDVIVIIPAYKPGENLISFTKNLIQKNLKIVVVDDGSGVEYQNVFDQLKNLNIIVLHHDRNLGKGRALKTGFNYCLNNVVDVFGVVTADDDGQHTFLDILKVVKRLKEKREELILGVRKFDKEVPFRSKLGNFVTKYFFYLITGQWLQDTQTGLRGIPIQYLSKLVKIRGEGYEYEINVLLNAKKLGIKIEQEPISTIYLHGNTASHFNPIKDSIKIYWSIIKFIFTGK
ncbi:MAG: glycosyltransferase family 2 protein [bacterium]